MVALIAVDHAGLLTASWLEPLEFALTLVVAPLLYLTVRAATGSGPARRDLTHVCGTLGRESFAQPGQRC